MDNIISESLSVLPVKRKNGIYALRLCVNQGQLTIGMLKNITETMAAFNLTSLRATTGQRMNLEGIPEDKLDDVVASLGVAVQKAPPGISVCTGAGICIYGKQETRAIADKVLELVKKNGPYPYKVKSGVSGCKMACGLSFVRDVGLVGGPKGWDVYFGGAATRNAGVGVQLGKNVTEDEALDMIDKSLGFYRESGRKRERPSGTVNRLGKEALLDFLK
ncbi:nitrite/sulfite reductase domain-containing protein [Maridesulfovibrio frigidus]|uniref:nitrite reductase n=1 Tax=Maridesulfovibrio frigidus TaxID=340956 RepID=UPI0004E25817|nr:nitrite reductase [Maridesulfovibrio frigidus]